MPANMSRVAARAAARAPRAPLMPAHLTTVPATPLRTSTRTRATSLVATQRDSTGRRSDWSRAATLRPVETAMTRAWSDTAMGQGTQYR